MALDANLVFFRDPLAHVPPYALTFASNEPIVRTRRCKSPSSVNRCRLNGGFFHVRPSKDAMLFLQTVSDLCHARAAGRDVVLDVGQSLLLHLGCFNFCTYINERVLLSGGLGQPQERFRDKVTVLYHATAETWNGSTALLRRHGLWRPRCVEL